MALCPAIKRVLFLNKRTDNEQGQVSLSHHKKNFDLCPESNGDPLKVLKIRTVWSHSILSWQRIAGGKPGWLQGGRRRSQQ